MMITLANKVILMMPSVQGDGSATMIAEVVRCLPESSELQAWHGSPYSTNTETSVHAAELIRQPAKPLNPSAPAVII